jgi:hypothetical protein
VFMFGIYVLSMNWDLCFIVFDELRSVFYILLSFVWLFI